MPRWLPAAGPISWEHMSGRSAGGRVLIASNRGPLSFSLDDEGQLTARRGGGGMVSGLSTVAGEAGMLWVAAALSDADRAAARAAPDGRLGLDGTPGGSGVRLLDIPAATFDAAYNAVANSCLWFVHHLLYDTPNQPSFGTGFRRDWEHFRAYNTAFAEALAAEAGPPGSPSAVRAVVQDYHLSLVPRMLADLRPDIRIAHFSHTPWAPPEYYRMLPDQVAREVLEGILGADHAGFLSQRWADSFLDCCADVLGAAVDRATQRVSYRGHVTGVAVHPLGVDADELMARAAEPDVQARLAALTEAAGGTRVIVRVDRTELSKNIARGLAAYRELLIAHPEWQGRVTHIAFAYPSRTDLPEYRAYTASVQRLASEINAEFGTADWQPLILEVLDDYARSLAAYRIADVAVVNPIRDGMNLVAKEVPIVADRGCALVLSREAGAADELGSEALLVNPYDVTATADALHQALSMTDSERARRSAALAKAGAAMPPQLWFAQQLAALGS
jgi:trehalose 6-phosphate synthase